MRPSSLKEDKKAERWPINKTSGDSFDKAWAHIIGVEAGWFVHDHAGFLVWTTAGRDKFASVVGIEVTKPISTPHHQPAAPEQEPIEPVQAEPTKPRQLDLF
jgi:hypothetical protein